VEDLLEPRHVGQQPQHRDLRRDADQQEPLGERPIENTGSRSVRQAIAPPICAMTIPANVIVVAST